jgi:tripartite-type tricarboxylate transporter receptor subunit TctC
MWRFRSFVWLALLWSGALIAQSYPAKPVRVVVPWPPGQATDLAARFVAMKLADNLGQPFVIDNRPGAGGTIGTDIAAKSPADGYTLLSGSSGPISVYPHLQGKLPFDWQKDLAPVSLVCTVPYLLAVSPSFPANNAAELIALVRTNPGKYNFASSGAGATGHLAMELFNSMAQLKAVHVPYKGSGPALTDVMSGQVGFIFETFSATVGHVKSGRLKALAVSSRERVSALPDVPTVAESTSLAGYETAAWIGYVAPAGTPRDILDKLAGEIRKILQTADMRERFTALGAVAQGSTPDELGTLMRNEYDKYGMIIRTANIKIE